MSGCHHTAWQALRPTLCIAVMRLTRLRCPCPLQHGQGLGDRFSVDYIFMDAQKAVNGTPATGVDEVVWLRAFLQARKALLASWDSTSAVSTPRITIYQKLVDIGKHMGEGSSLLFAAKQAGYTIPPCHCASDSSRLRPPWLPTLQAISTWMAPCTWTLRSATPRTPTASRCGRSPMSIM